MTVTGIQELGSDEFRKKYHVVAKLGEGGMALVHLAVVRGAAGVRKLVVLKSVRPELVADANARNMFVAEARLAATLSHPNIVQTFEVVLSKGRPILVMEFLDGQPFSRIVRRGRSESASLAMQLHVIKEVLAGLEYVHNCTDLDGTALNLVHRDMSPQNVFVTYEGQVKILDFGIAKVVGSTGHTETGEIKGKIRYMAPEQMLGSARLDRRADIFSAGVLLWEAATQRRLWEGMADVQVIQTVVAGGVPAPSSVAPDVHPALDAICRRALAHDCEERYESAAEMQQDVEQVIDLLGLRMATRHVGKVVAESFADLRASIKTVVEGQLRDEKAAPINLLVSEENGVLAEEAALSGDLWGLPSAVSIGHATENAARRRRAVSIATAAAAVVIVASVASFRRFGGAVETPHAEPAQAALKLAGPPALGTPPAGVPAASDPRTVHVQIAAEPAYAKLFFDDALLGTNTFSGTMKADSLTHTLRVEAPGYRTQSIAVSLERPVDTKVKLDAMVASVANVIRPPVQAKGAVTTAVSTSVTAPPAASSASHPSCGVPFYIDDQGIKRIRPECLK
ncbi:MAG: serine/threonine protein kinase [Polyangiaceae bacterium]|nr:serine/threonine protein kinase [Polyangiaceae bacterium]